MATLKLGSPQGVAVFEALYLDVRQKENRLLTIPQLRAFPDLTGFPHLEEWKVRLQSAKRLLRYLGKEEATVLDVGCGNGWLSSLLARHGFHVTGVDINRYELEQAAEAYDFLNLEFICDDIFYPQILEGRFTYIILSSSLQYFQDLPNLFSSLLGYLGEEGEIHVINTHLYSETEAIKAKQRTRKYYSDLGFPEMANHYFHHTWTQIARLGGKKMRGFWRRSYFPWVRFRFEDLRRALR
ncbi:MAG: class I SAM-dependent methyltransferase [Methanobacteriota archaeon]|nr:MAG: class I SAM-dependent methyltransferase [Euryarchaeota archaeon]